MTIPTDLLQQVIDFCLDPDDEAHIDDLLIDLIDEYGIDQDQADAIMTAARTIDPTDSHFAATVRDCIRDNSELTIS